MAHIPSAPRNPGPGWGQAFLRRADRLLPLPLFNAGLAVGTAAAVGLMPAARRHSRDYLSLILKRPPRLRDIWRHFFAFARTLMLKIRVADGRSHRCAAAAGSEGFVDLLESGRPALFGTLHLGDSDMLGFFLAEIPRRVHMIRLKVGNSADTEWLARRFGSHVTYIWVNERENLLFALKGALEAGSSVAMECDRPDYSAKLEAFQFLGARRLFPFSIYHLSLIFRLPVVFCVGVPGRPGETLVHGTLPFEPDGGSRASNLARAKNHFQDFLRRVESLLHDSPFLWFNFTPLNPQAGPGG